MFYTPHKLFLITENPTQVDENGDPVPNAGGESESYLCDCFLHDVSTKIKEGYAGIGISVNYYVNMARRNDLKLGQEVIIREADNSVRGKGKIEDVKMTGGMQFGGAGNYTTIFI